MDKRLAQLIDESIKLELNVAALYKIFSKAFPGDFAFWSKLALEEEHHASIIRGARVRLSEKEFPYELLAPTVDTLIETNSKLASLLEEYSKMPPSREVAFNVACNLEESAGEVHFQRSMEQPPTSTIMEVLQLLNKDDKDHARRIRAYMSDEGIELHNNLMN